MQFYTTKVAYVYFFYFDIQYSIIYPLLVIGMDDQILEDRIQRVI